MIKSSFRSQSIVLINSTGAVNTVISDVVRLPHELNVFRIHVQAEMTGGEIDAANALPTGGVAIPYVAVNGQNMGINPLGIKLYVNPYQVSGTTEILALPSYTLVLDRRSTDTIATDNIYVSAHRLSDLAGYNSMKVNFIFEGYM
jgi:hypothetical protein